MHCPLVNKLKNLFWYISPRHEGEGRINWRTRRTKYSPSCPLVPTSGQKYRTVLTTGRDENTSCPLSNEHTIYKYYMNCSGIWVQRFERLWRFGLTFCNVHETKWTRHDKRDCDVAQWYTSSGCRGRLHKVGPAAKVGPCPFAVVNNGTGNFSLVVLSNMPEDTNERYQNTGNAISKMWEWKLHFTYFS